MGFSMRNVVDIVGDAARSAPRAQARRALREPRRVEGAQPALPAAVQPLFLRRRAAGRRTRRRIEAAPIATCPIR